jgi:hypothetical protein
MLHGLSSTPHPNPTKKDKKGEYHSSRNLTRVIVRLASSTKQK